MFHDNHKENDGMVRILLVEDSPVDAELVMMRLEQADLPLKIQQVDNEKQYRQALSQPFDLIISDWSLPNFSGMQALTIRNELGLDIPFIINSGSIGEEAAVAAMRLGATDYLLKDRPKRLPQAVINALNKRQTELARKRAEDLVRLQSVALNSAANSIMITDCQGIIEWVNPAFCKLTGYTFNEALGKQPGELVKSGLQSEVFYREFWESIQSGKPWQGVMVNRRKDGRLYYQEQVVTPMLNQSGQVEKFIAIQQDITERREKELEIEKQNSRLQLLFEAGKKLSQSLDLNNIYSQFYYLVKEVMDCDRFFVADFFDQSQLIVARYAVSEDRVIDVSHFPPLPLEAEGEGIQSPVIRSGKPGIFSGTDSFTRIMGRPIEDADQISKPSVDQTVTDGTGTQSMLILPIIFQNKVRGIVQIQSKQVDAYDEEDLHIAQSLVAQIAVACNNAMLYDQSLKEIEFRKQVEASLLNISGRQEKIAALARDLATTMDIGEIYRISKKYIGQLIDCTLCAVGYLDEDSNQITPAYLNLDGQEYDLRELPGSELQPLSGCKARAKAIATQTPVVAGDILDSDESLGCAWKVEGHPFQSAFFIPMVVEGHVIGVIDLQSTRKHAYKEEDSEWLSVVANLIGMVYRNTSLYLKTQHRMEELAALHAIDTAVISHAEIEDTFNMILDQIKNRLEVDAGNILLFDPSEQCLKYFAGFGFFSKEISQTQLQIGEGLAGKCALERRLIQVPSLIGNDPAFKDTSLWKREGFVTSYNLPLIINSKLLGVLAVFKRSSFKADQDWLLFFEVLASQIAIVMDYMNVIHDLQRANEDLLKAYDATIEGWSQAMDLRDHETEGHTLRVTQLTLRLASAQGMNQENLVHIRRGALLHDIGKLGVPDSILLKEGPLNEEEWAIMKKHPVYAHQMLKPIEYLNPALDIPYCHHERWDGSGYPNRLLGEKIPLAARIFAIVDVWDALTSDRPYRAAWSAEKAMAFIQEQAGKQFDPNLVKLFVQYMLENEEYQFPKSGAGEKELIDQTVV